MQPQFLFEWDEEKSATNQAKHGLGFDLAWRLFLVEQCIELDASRPADGEQRLKRIGPLFGRLTTVVFTRRGEKTRLISARAANDGEMKRYGDRPPKD